VLFLGYWIVSIPASFYRYFENMDEAVKEIGNAQNLVEAKKLALARISDLHISYSFSKGLLYLCLCFNAFLMLVFIANLWLLSKGQAKQDDEK
jgi:hypothetical protein